MTIEKSSGSCAAALAFGRVASVMQSIERVLAIVGPQPAAYVRRVRAGGADAPAFAPIVHRWTRGPISSRWCGLMRQMIDRARVDRRVSSRRATIAAATTSAARSTAFRRARWRSICRRPYGQRAAPSAPGVCYFFPRPSAAQRCKRLNLFLRWMVRRDALDLGVWTRVLAGAS